MVYVLTILYETKEIYSAVYYPRALARKSSRIHLSHNAPGLDMDNRRFILHGLHEHISYNTHV